MAQPIFLGAGFQSYADFQTAFDQYCRQNAVSNVPLAYVRQSSKKLAANTFSDELPLDQQTIDRFVYKSISFICVHHRSHSSKKDGLFCEGRITLRYVQEQNLLRISTFFELHSNHNTSTGNFHIDNSAQQPVNDDRLNRIFALVRQMPDDALNLVEHTCESILEKWEGDNDGLEIHLIEKENHAPAVIKSEPSDNYAADTPPIKSEKLD